jgi:hypothetical protein
MPKLSPEFIEEFKEAGETALFNGRFVKEYDRDELLAIIGCLGRELFETRERLRKESSLAWSFAGR